MSARAVLFLLLLVVTAGAVVTRAVLSGTGGAGDSPLQAPAGADGDGARGFLPGGTGPQPEGSLGLAEAEGAAGGGAADVLPYVSEGGFFAILGFALGYASKKVLKLFLILLAVFFVAVQGLAYADVLSVDWERAVDLANRFLLNVRDNQTAAEIVKDKLPSAGGLVAGYAIGFRKG